MIRTPRTRRGFTLVELLVAAAMMILGMWLLSWVYQQGLESFRQARAQSELTNQQRMVTSVLTRDLTAAHFTDDSTKPNNGRRLSDQTKGWIDGTGYTPPLGGFFRAGSFPPDGTNNIWEGNDSIADSSRSTNHFLQFTAILPGGPSHQLFSAEVPAYSGKQYFSTAAEVAYFLRQTGQTAGGVPLFDLYRQQRIVARNTDDAPAYASAASVADAPEVMVVSGGQMQTLRELTIPMGYPGSVRNPGPVFTPQTVRFSEDKLMSNVLSFEVKFTGTADSASGVTWPRPFLQNTDYPYDTLPYDGRFDTFSSYVTNWNNASNIATTGNPTAPMKPLRITGTMIRLRTYDTRTNSTRQTTLTLDL